VAAAPTEARATAYRACTDSLSLLTALLIYACAGLTPGEVGDCGSPGHRPLLGPAPMVSIDDQLAYLPLMYLLLITLFVCLTLIGGSLRVCQIGWVSGSSTKPWRWLLGK
jgi:hypothetical protein